MITIKFESSFDIKYFIRSPYAIKNKLNQTSLNFSTSKEKIILFILQN